MDYSGRNFYCAGGSENKEYEKTVEMWKLLECRNCRGRAGGLSAPKVLTPEQCYNAGISDASDFCLVESKGIEKRLVLRKRFF